jgi:hypothetical protein
MQLLRFLLLCCNGTLLVRSDISNVRTSVVMVLCWWEVTFSMCAQVCSMLSGQHNINYEYALLLGTAYAMLNKNTVQ